MSDTDSIDDAMLAAVAQIAEGARQLADGYADALGLLRQYTQAAFRQGGAYAVEDVANVANPKRLHDDVAAVLRGAGLSGVLDAAMRTARSDDPDAFVARWEARVASGKLRSNRRRPEAGGSPATPGQREYSPYGKGVVTSVPRERRIASDSPMGQPKGKLRDEEL